MMGRRVFTAARVTLHTAFADRQAESQAGNQVAAPACQFNSCGLSISADHYLLFSMILAESGTERLILSRSSS